MKNQRGAAIVDLIIGVGITLMMLVWMAQLSVAFNESRKADRQGTRLAAGANALQDLFNKHGATIASAGVVPGFANIYAPTAIELRTASFLPTFVGTSMPYGGNMSFVVRKGANNDLLGIVCGDGNITKHDQPAPHLAGLIERFIGGNGLRTSIAFPSQLSGVAFQDIVSPVSGSAIVCAWAFLPNPT